ncbi:DUF4145 domain-containing protein [Rathayibacter sp. VKM Ac-2835]|uniref:DUF4145 domain-containing protein n=1 Tax=Rathayibacter sp. VKM Ac-2835 TaxID=2739043 RepID=UPI001C27186B|nr:DUF4145 domain-containing protein [Rathayibacter sp. VKM Ac-2835]
MPPAALELYDEARAVADISRRAAAALARASLERLLRTVRPDFRGQLDDRIADVAPLLSTATGRLLTALRHVGNKSLHVEDEADEIVSLYLGDVAAGVIELFFAAINDVTEELVAKPAEADRIWSMLPEGVRAEAERKAAAESK